MISYNFIIPGDPEGYRRARFARVGAFVKVHPAEDQVKFETYVRELFVLAHPGFEPLIGAVAVFLMIYQGIPASESEKKKRFMREGLIRPEKKPDLDNILKVIMDALSGLAYRDDKQVYKSAQEKFYADRPRVEVSLVPFNPEIALHLNKDRGDLYDPAGVIKAVKEFGGRKDL